MRAADREQLEKAKALANEAHTLLVLLDYESPCLIGAADSLADAYQQLTTELQQSSGKETSR